MSFVRTLYEQHHVTGKRLRQSFMESERGVLFSGWIGTGKAVLDLGGRDGALTRHFVDGNRVTLADIDSAALEYAKDHLEIDTVEVNLNEPLPLPNDAYDCIVMAEVIEHLPYPRSTLAEAQRVLRQGGLFIGSIPLAYHLKDRWQVLCGKKLWMAGDPTHLQFYRYSEFISLLSEFFEIEDVTVLKGGAKGRRWPSLFARDIAFRCKKR